VTADARLRAWAIGVVATVGMVVAVLFAPTAERGDPTVEVLTQLLLAVGVAVTIGVLLMRLPPAATGFLIALLTGLFLCGGAAVMLNATDFAPLGVVADQSYRTAYITKFAHGWGLVDYAYRDLPSFYPPLYFWILGRLSALLDVEAWKMLKVGLLAVAFIVPTAGWMLWRPLTGPRRAAVVVVATSLLFQDWYVPHLWLATALFVPWWLRYVLGVGRDRPLSRGAAAVGILLGAVVALTYWYLLLIGLLHLAVLLALRRRFRRQGLVPQPPSLRDVALVLGGTALVTAVYWLPLAVSFLTTSGAQTMQNRFFTADEVSLPLPFLEFDVKGMILLFGLLALAVTASRRMLSLHLLGLVGAAYVLYVIGYIGFLADTPLDTLRTHGLIEFSLATGAALGAADLARLLWTKQVHELVDPSMARGAIVVLAVVVVFAVGQTAVRDIPYLNEQREARYPTALIDTFKRGTDGRYEDSVVLTDITDLSAYLPTYVFNTSNAHYSHPSALFNDRADLLKRLANETDTDVFALALAHNRYDRIDYVALKGGANVLTYEYLSDAFPRGVGFESLEFSRDSFSSPLFTETADRGIAVYRVNRDRDPLLALRSCPRDPVAPKCAVLGQLLLRYSGDLDDETRDLATEWRKRR
jgi:galactan 5-O-arabinofuranosyltransferase